MPNRSGKENSSKEIDQAEHWTCPCGQLLGVATVDPISGELALHIKHKDMTVVSYPGAGGWLRRNCTKCGRTWTIKDEGEEVKVDVV